MGVLLHGHRLKMSGQNTFLTELEGFAQLWDGNRMVTSVAVNKETVSPWEVHWSIANAVCRDSCRVGVMGRGLMALKPTPQCRWGTRMGPCSQRRQLGHFQWDCKLTPSPTAVRNGRNYTLRETHRDQGIYTLAFSDLLSHGTWCSTPGNTHQFSARVQCWEGHLSDSHCSHFSFRLWLCTWSITVEQQETASFPLSIRFPPQDPPPLCSPSHKQDPWAAAVTPGRAFWWQRTS